MDMEKIMNPSKFYGASKIGFNLDDNPVFRRVRNTLVSYAMPTTLFDRNLKTLEMRKDNTKGSTFGEVLGSYDPKRNKILEPSDSRDLIHEVFHMASNRKDDSQNMGVLEYNFGASVNEGITELFSYLSTLNENNPDDKYEIRYPIEKLFAEFLGSMYGFKIFKHHFNCEPRKFMDEFGEDKDRVQVLISELDKLTRAKNDFINMKEIDYNEMANSFINAFGGFIDLAISKNPSYGNAYFELIRGMLRQKIESVDSFKTMMELSDFGNIDNIVDVIGEHCFGEVSKL